MTCVRKNISITSQQEAFLKESNLSLSKLVQKALAKEMQDFRFAMKVRKDLREMDRGAYEEMELDDFLKEVKQWSQSGSPGTSAKNSRKSAMQPHKKKS